MSGDKKSRKRARDDEYMDDGKEARLTDVQPTQHSIVPVPVTHFAVGYHIDVLMSPKWTPTPEGKQIIDALLDVKRDDEVAHVVNTDTKKTETKMDTVEVHKTVGDVDEWTPCVIACVNHGKKLVTVQIPQSVHFTEPLVRTVTLPFSHRRLAPLLTYTDFTQSGGMLHIADVLANKDVTSALATGAALQKPTAMDNTS